MLTLLKCSLVLAMQSSVARGLVGTPHRPVGLRSGPKMGLLRSPTGASPLATGNPLATINRHDSIAGHR
ncbi:hypothetical protein C1X64_11915 [Pseudomonas sp. GW456-E7]|nr:hypothetical protein C1X64_11915 [Pseudomonas sp. GW456-E7]